MMQLTVDDPNLDSGDGKTPTRFNADRSVSRLAPGR